MRSYIFAALLVLAGALPACQDELPTGTNGDLVPGAPRSVEIFLPFDEVAGDVQYFQGFGTQARLPISYLARDFEGTLDSHVLTRYPSFPRTITAPDLEGTSRTDSLYTVIGGRIVARLDTAGVARDSVRLRLDDLTTPWDPGSASWELAVDTAGRQVAWPEPGGGTVEFLDSATWLPQDADSVVFELDSATVVAWDDPQNETRGVRLELLDTGQRHEVREVELQIRAQPSFPSNPLFVPLSGRVSTFIYTPDPSPPEGGFIFAGAPSWRTVFTFQIPEALDGPPELCQALGCPLVLEDELINYAALVLATRETELAFQTQDTLGLEVRPVIRPDLLPKSPLDGPVTSTVFRGLDPEFFIGQEGEAVEIPLTQYVGNLVDEDVEEDDRPSPTVAILSPSEPSSFMYGSFQGTESATPPRLRLILTRADPVDLP